MTDHLTEYLNRTINMLEAMLRVPKWRLVIAFFFLGKEFIDSLNELAKLKED